MDKDDNRSLHFHLQLDIMSRSEDCASSKPGYLNKSGGIELNRSNVAYK